MTFAFMRSIGAVALIALGTSQVAAGPMMDKIRETGRITVATEASYPPFEFVENGQIVGYGKDILTEVMAALSKEVGREVTLEQLDLPFQGILPGLLAEQFDLVATSVGINAERAARYAYTRPIAASYQTAMIRVGDAEELTSVEDLDGKVVGTQIASASEPVVRAFDEKLKGEGKDGLADIKLFTSYPETYVALANGQIDAVVQSGPALSVLMKQRPGIFELLGPISDNPSYLAWVVRPADGDLRDFINGVLADLKSSGKLTELQEKWFGFAMETPDENYLPEGAL
jgi:polar amino acid transport system substrate-binding protein